MGNKELVLYLERKGPKRVAYFDFAPDMKAGGHVANPVWWDGAPPFHIIHYRNNRTSKPVPGDPPVMNKTGIDLWAADAKGRPWGLNSWE